MKEAEELRRLVERQEREELREDVARTLQEGIGTDELGEALRRLIRQSLEEVVQQALEGERVRKVIERHVTDRILTSVAGELRDAQQELLAEARNDLAKAWRKEASAILLGSLRKETTESVRQGIREGLQDVSFRKEILLALRETQEEDRPEEFPTVREPRPSTVFDGPAGSQEGDSERRPPMVSLPRRWPLPLLSPLLVWFRRRPRIFVGIGVLILVGLTVLFWMMARPPKRSSKTSSTPAFEPVPQPPDRLREIWMERMTSEETRFRSYYGLTEALAKYSFSDQFDCWFDPEEARYRLDDLLETSHSGDLRDGLRRAFAPCVQERYAGPPGDRLPILGAQAIVLDLLRRYASENWQPCRVGFPELLDLDHFQIDGVPGYKTAELLNGYLMSCTSISPSLKINSESTAPEYLFVLYAALKDLQDRTSP